MSNPPFPVTPGSPLDAVFGGEPGGSVPMPWSLGVLGDLLWTRLPEARPLLAAKLIRHIEEAVDYDRELFPVQAGDMVPDVLWWPLLKPALDGYPDTRERVAEQLSVAYDAYRAEGPDRAAIQDALYHYLIEHLAGPPYAGIVAELHPDLAGLVRSLIPDPGSRLPRS